MATTAATDSTRATWRSVRFTRLVRSVLVAFYAALALVSADLSFLYDSDDSDLGAEPRPAPGAVRATLAVGLLTGSWRRAQIDVYRSWSYQWQRRGTLVRGVAWRTRSGELAWAPTRRWQRLGARAMLVPLPAITGVEVLRRRWRPPVFVVRSDEGEQWLIGDVQQVLDDA